MSRQTVRSRSARQRGVAAVLAMMFIVIFGSLAAALAIVSQANLSTADSHLKVNRARAAAETGMQFTIYRLNQITRDIQTRDGEITTANAPELWELTREALFNAFAGELHNVREPFIDGNGALHVGPIAVGANDPRFTVSFAPHPLPGENYGSSYYQRPPYSQMDPAVSAGNPLDNRWIRIRVQAFDGPVDAVTGEPGPRAITRSVQMDFRMDKKIRFAILSRSRVMIGPHVMIEGPIGSRFTETWIEGGHPIQMQSDFRGLSADLDAELEDLAGVLHLNDRDGDNRLRLEDDAEMAGIDDPEQFDLNGDGYIDEWDFFLAHFGRQHPDTGQWYVLEGDLVDGADDAIRARELFALIDTFGSPDRPGYGDGVLDDRDRYAKVRGEIVLTASFDDWFYGAGNQFIQDYYRGPVHPRHGEAALTFDSDENHVHEFESTDIDTSSFRDDASGDLFEQAAAQAESYDPDDPDSPRPLGLTVLEAVPYGAAHPYDYYDRPIFENMVFENVTIPRGTNALFRNCTFIGVTFIETETGNSDPDFNLTGMVELDGSPRHPDRTAFIPGVGEVDDTKPYSNNIRFDGCTFEGAVVTSAPQGYTHVRNKLSFTGRTRFIIADSTSLTEQEKERYRRSTILGPHFSVEMGTFTDPTAMDELVELSGTIIAGVIDMRGRVSVNGTILTTFEPRSHVPPVMGETSPLFNTTLGYFSSEDGDGEAEMPASGLGIIKLRYDDTIPLPDGVLGPIEIRPLWASYFEGGA